MIQSTALPVIDLKRIKDARDAELLAALPQQIHAANVPEPPAAQPNENVPAPQPQAVSPTPSGPDGSTAGVDPRVVQADKLTQQAAPPSGPKGFSQNAASMVGSFANAFANPQHYQEIELQKQGMERQREQDLLTRAQELRKESTSAAQLSLENGRQSGQDYRQQQQDTQNQAQRQFQNTQEAADNASKIDLQKEQVKKLRQAEDPNYTLKEGETRFDGNNKPIASNAPKPAAATKEDKDLAAYMADPVLVAKFGPGIIGMNKYNLDQTEGKDGRLAAAASSRSLANEKVMQDIKNASGGELQKAQTVGAVLTQSQIDNVRDIVKRKPQLVGPIVGQLEKLEQKIGTSPASSPEDEHDAADLANGLGNLVVNEAKTGFARSSPQALDRIKSFSAQIQQNPNMINGFLDGAQKQSDMTLKAMQDLFSLGPGPAHDEHGNKIVKAPTSKAAPAEGGKHLYFDANGHPIAAPVTK